MSRVAQQFGVGQRVGDTACLYKREGAGYCSPGGKNQRTVVVVCFCGTEFETALHRLLAGTTRSCGCLRTVRAREKNTTHGMTGAPEHNAWTNVGGKASAWPTFDAFLADVGYRPTPKHTFLRPNPNRPAGPGNGAWTMHKDNRRDKAAVLTEMRAMFGDAALAVEYRAPRAARTSRQLELCRICPGCGDQGWVTISSVRMYNSIRCQPCGTREAAKRRVKHPTAWDAAVAQQASHYRNGDADCDLTNEEFAFLAEQDCRYCSVAAAKATKGRRVRGVTHHLMGIDRIDNTRAHTYDNVVPCCKKCNFAKRNMPLSEWREYLARFGKRLGRVVPPLVARRHKAARKAA